MNYLPVAKHNGTEIVSMMRQRGTSLTLKTQDADFECTVLLLWTKNTVDDQQDEDTTNEQN